MTVSPIGQGKVFLINIAFGIFCVVLFDFFYVLRKRYGKTVIIVNALDGLYFLSAFIVIFYAGVKFNFGALRYYQIFGLMTGILTGSLFSRIDRIILDKIYGAVCSVVCFLWRVIYKPVMLVLRIILTPLCFFEEKSVAGFDKVRKKFKKVKIKRIKNTKTVKKRIKMI